MLGRKWQFGVIITMVGNLNEPQSPEQVNIHLTATVCSNMGGKYREFLLLLGVCTLFDGMSIEGEGVMY